MNILKNFVEYQNWGLNLATISAIGTVLFTTIQAFGTMEQAKKIWSERSGKSVSLHLFSYNTAYFLMFLIYGFYQHSLAIILNGLLVLAFLYVAMGLWRFKKISIAEKIISVLYLLIAPAMIFFSQKDIIVSIGLAGLAIFFIQQITEVIKEKSFGSFSIKFVLIFLATCIFWLIFSICIRNLPLIFFNSLSIILYCFAVFLYYRYQ